MLQYQTLAQRTSPDDGHDRMDNGVLGLIGETGEVVDLYKKYRYQSLPGAELPKARIIDELGDVLWYIAELSQGMGKNMKEILMGDFDHFNRMGKRHARYTKNERSMIIGMSVAAGSLAEHAEKCSFPMMERRARKIMECAGYLAQICGSDLQGVAEKNIEKLKKRYPKGFDAAISEARYR